MKANEFKVGDLVVMADESDYDTIFEVIGRTLRMYQLKGVDDLFYGRLPIQIQHATSEEIKVGHRFEQSSNECDHDWEDISSIGDTERKLICTYCSKQKSEPFGVNAARWGGDQ